ncbi:MAG: TonB-dependent receptor [Proteobacteria bacterium]|nr:TonB-dependent receptor [Pseudomonadota bacterium]
MSLALLSAPLGVEAQEQEAADPEEQATAGEETQEAEAAAPAGPDAVRQPETAIEEIVVTGSRIRRKEFTASLPVTVITPERATLAGMADTAEILQSSPLAQGTQIDNSFGGFVISGGAGINTFGLRGLDPKRTLILVNGRRFSPAGVRGQVSNVDLNTIPDVLIDRIEILKDGASAVYGADAVAGVVNVITRKQFDSVLAEAYYQDVTDSGRASFGWGEVFDRGFFDLAAQLTYQAPVRWTDRDWAECPRRPRKDGSLDGRCFGTVNGFAITPFTTEAGGWLGYDEDADFRGTGLPFNEEVPFYRDTLEPDFEDIYSRENTFSFYGDGAYDFTLPVLGGVTADFEAYFTRRENSRQGGFRQFFPYVASGNPTNPFGAFGSWARPVLLTSGWLDPESTVEVETWNLRAGLEGNLGRFEWEFNLGHGWNRANWKNSGILKRQTARALSATRDANGQLSCTLDPGQLLWSSGFDQALVGEILAAGPDPSCVPLDLFTREAMLDRQLPAAAVAYITVRDQVKTDYDLTTADFGINGALFGLPAGDVQGAFGFEFRDRAIDDRPPLDSVNDNYWGFTSAGRTRGDDTVTELYAELEIPLLAGFELGGVSLAEELTFNYSYRWTDYSSYGSDTVYRAVVNWAPNRAVRMRGSYGTSFRAPALFELFLANQTGFSNGSLDPCYGYNVNPDTTSTIYQNCLAQDADGLLPTGWSDESVGAPSILTLTGGNQDLEAETADSWTLGLVLTPDLETRFPSLGVDVSLAVDYYDIDLSDSISRLSAGGILARCYGSPGLTSTYCGLVGDRNDQGYLSSVNSSYVNVATERVRGYDITLRTGREFGFGDLSVDLLAARLLSNQFGLSSSDLTQYVGHYTFPKWTGEADIRFQRDKWMVQWYVRYIGHTRETDYVNDPNWITSVDAIFYHSLSVRYRDDDNGWSWTVGVRNLFDKDPPVVSQSGSTSSLTTNVYFNVPLGAGFDLSGRRIHSTFAYEF